MCFQVQYMVFNMDISSQNGFFPYLLVDKGYPLLPQIMTFHKEGQQYSILELLYNKRHICGCLIVENAFGIVKKEFQGVSVQNKFGCHLGSKWFHLVLFSPKGDTQCKIWDLCASNDYFRGVVNNCPTYFLSPYYYLIL